MRRTGTAARIEVWDTGCGIAHEDQQTIFKEFERLSPSNSDTGLGLGLSIVERACKGLDHPLSLWSEPNVGSCFSLSVPIHTEQSKASEAELSMVPHPVKTLTDQLFLLVEDNPQLAQATTAQIESFGSTVIHAHTAEEALEILSEIQLVPDAMLIDYQLGAGLDGIELIKEITLRYGPVPAAVVSAERTKVLRDACKSLDIQLIPKPLEKERLRRLLLDMFMDTGS